MFASDEGRTIAGFRAPVLPSYKLYRIQRTVWCSQEYSKFSLFRPQSLFCRYFMTRIARVTRHQRAVVGRETSSLLTGRKTARYIRSVEANVAHLHFIRDDAFAKSERVVTVDADRDCGFASSALTFNLPSRFNLVRSCSPAAMPFLNFFRRKSHGPYLSDAG